jgi:hypothetical protein
MRYTVWSLVALLVILHQDYWQWDNGRLVSGFLPYPLLYHSALSVGAAVVWWMATEYCWPTDLDTLRVEAEEALP